MKWHKITDSAPMEYGDYLIKFEPGYFTVATWRPDRNNFGYEDGDHYFTTESSENVYWTELKDPASEETDEEIEAKAIKDLYPEDNLQSICKSAMTRYEINLWKRGYKKAIES